jgi:hypothetical protein
MTVRGRVGVSPFEAPLAGELQAWLRAHDIDPNMVPVYAIPTIVHRPDESAQVVCPMFVRPDGVQLTLGGDCVVTAVVRDLVARPSSVVAEWLDQAAPEPTTDNEPTVRGVH